MMNLRHSLKKVIALVGTTSSAYGFSNTMVSTMIGGGATTTSSALFSTAAESIVSAKNVLFDVPVSNNGARARVILYKKEIPESECAIVSPSELGGFKSEDYLKINPQGKVPSLKCQTTGESIAESDTVCRYLMDTYSYLGPSFQPNNSQSNEIARFHDMYLTTIQSCLYRAVVGRSNDRPAVSKPAGQNVSNSKNFMEHHGKRENNGELQQTARSESSLKELTSIQIT